MGCVSTSVFQEKAQALAENKALPKLYDSADIRPLNTEDFKSAHEQVKTETNYTTVQIFVLYFLS